MARVAVIGSGYVGLTTAACLAHLGHFVEATDVDPARLARITDGDQPLVEPGLRALVDEGMRREQLSFSADNAAAAGAAEFVFLCTPTPGNEAGVVDASSLRSALAGIREALLPGAVVVVKSTCPLGFNAEATALLGRDDVSVVSNPEFLSEGNAVSDFLHPDRIVIGATEGTAAERVALLYAGLGGQRIILDPGSAELVKYASNAFLATKVAFVNVIASLCESLGAQINEVARAVGADHRIGPDFLKAGPGFGGSCLPKDTRALTAAVRSAGCPGGLLEAVLASNEAQQDRMALKVARLAGGALRHKRIALWGLSFKAGTDDLRCSPAIGVAERLAELGAVVRGYDPSLLGAGRVGPVKLLSDRYSACKGASVLVIATEWGEFARSDWQKVAELMRVPAVLDTRNLLEASLLRRHGFAYEGVGLGISSVTPARGELAHDVMESVQASGRHGPAGAAHVVLSGAVG